MPSPPVKFVAGNWKMNGLQSQLGEVRALVNALKGADGWPRVAIFPPATLIHQASGLLAGSPIELGAQDVHTQAEGAHTGDLSAEILFDAGARLTLVGHSERRTDHGETDEVVRAKAEAALRAGLEPVICLGETLAEREAGRTLEVVASHLAASLPASLAGRAFSVAYEPVWAIGTGLTPTVEQVGEVHAALRSALDARFPTNTAAILYGGSVKPSNAAELMAVQGVDGGLVGGASLKAADFLSIIRAA
ncbi:triose-phosphate isomerase [soil metagenome]